MNPTISHDLLARLFRIAQRRYPAMTPVIAVVGSCG